MTKVFDKYQKTDEATEILKKEVEDRRKAIEKKQEDISSLKQKLELQGVVMNEGDKAEMEGDVEAKIKELKDLVEKSNEALRKWETKLTRDICDDIEEIVKTYGRDNGYDLILDSQKILYGLEGMDVTNEIIKVINKKSRKKGKGG